MEMVFGCKKCKKVFRKGLSSLIHIFTYGLNTINTLIWLRYCVVVDMTDYDDSDEYCPHCDNKYVLEAKTPEMGIGIEGDDPRLNNRLFKDPRMKLKQPSLDDFV
jgi:hypothetical protein